MAERQDDDDSFIQQIELAAYETHKNQGGVSDSDRKKKEIENPRAIFMEEGHKTSVSHVMTLKDHIFVVVPKTLKDEVDWRLPVFDCGRHLIAFDGAALLLNSIHSGERRERGEKKQLFNFTY